MVGSNLKVMRSNQSVVGGDRLTYSGEVICYRVSQAGGGELVIIKRGFLGTFGELEGRFWVKVEGLVIIVEVGGPGGFEK